jgi:hypothetical protein
MGWEWNFIMADPGQVHSDCRTIFKKSIGQSEVESYAALIDDETERFVKELAKVSGDPWEIVQSYVHCLYPFHLVPLSPFLQFLFFSLFFSSLFLLLFLA